MERTVTEAVRLCIISLIAAIFVAAVDFVAVDVAALDASSVGIMIVVWLLRDASRLKMWSSCWVDLSSSAAAYSIAVV